MIIFFNNTATTEIYTLSLHDALPIFFDALQADGTAIVFISHKLNEVLEVSDRVTVLRRGRNVGTVDTASTDEAGLARLRPEEHTSELQSHQYPVCRLLLVKKKNHTLC